TLYPVPCTLYPVPGTLDPVPCTLYPVPCTLYPVPCTLYPVPCTLYPVPCALYPQPSTLNPEHRRWWRRCRHSSASNELIIGFLPTKHAKSQQFVTSLPRFPERDVPRSLLSSTVPRSVLSGPQTLNPEHRRW
ncbi:hypothetical protein T484DRAFT_1630770, partial [Baffinella frigidus]